MAFEISNTGIWINPTLEGHAYDQPLSNAICDFLKSEELSSIADFGCGPGYYVRDLRDANFNVVRFDGKRKIRQQ